jgi:hypothetical protein
MAITKWSITDPLAQEQKKKQADPIATNIDSNPTYKAPYDNVTEATKANTVQTKEPAPQYDPNAVKPETVTGNTQNINDLYAAQESQRRSQLEAKRNAALSRLNQESTKIQPYYEGQRTTLGGQVQTNRNKFAEYLANRGLTRSGAAAQAEIVNQGRLQSGLAGLGQDEANAFAEIERQKTLANQNYDTDLTDIQSMLGAEKARALLAEDTRLQDLNRQLKADAENKAYRDYQIKYNAWLQDQTMSRADEATTYQQGRDKVADTRYENTYLQNQQDKQKEEFAKSIMGLGNQFDYQASINQYQNDGDATNDWRIPLLQQEREKKIQTNLQNDIASIGQYGNDYQAEINRRVGLNANDALLPYLKMAQAQKLQTMKTNALSTQQQNQKDALAMFKELGYATPEIAKILGIPENAKTTDYIKTQYDTSKPYYKESSSSNGDSNTLKKSPYFESLNDNVYGFVKGLSDKQDKAGNPLSNYINKVGTVEHKQFTIMITNAINNGIITSSEGEMLFNLYGVPY